MLQFVTDFADQAVVLPVAGVTAVALLLAGWRRGALAWVLLVGGVLGCILVLKLLLAACGGKLAWASLRSPSGHVASAALVYGGLAGLLAPGTRSPSLVAGVVAAAVAVPIALTRLALGMHTLPEVAVAAAVAIAGAVAMRRLAGTGPRVPPAPVLLAALLAIVLLHGVRLDAEGRIRHAAVSLWPLSRCAG